MLILVYLLNPVVTSLRDVQQASELDKVQKKLGCSRSSLGWLSESATVFDPQRPKEIISELSEELKPLDRDSQLSDIKLTMTLVDGTIIAALPKLTQLPQQLGLGVGKDWNCGFFSHYISLVLILAGSRNPSMSSRIF